jgi:hypothetical protein
MISRSAEGQLQGAVQAALGLMSALTAAIGKFSRLSTLYLFFQLLTFANHQGQFLLEFCSKRVRTSSLEQFLQLVLSSCFAAL